MGKKKRCVAYAVFNGYKPGVYDTWSETRPQVHGFSGAKQRGYTVDDGGRVKAEEDYRQSTERKAVVRKRPVGASVGSNEKSQANASAQEKGSHASARHPPSPLGLHPGSNDRPNTRFTQPTFLSRGLNGSSYETARGAENAAGNDEVASSTRASSDVAENSFPMVRREKKKRPTSWELDQIPSRKVSRLEDSDRQEREGETVLIKREGNQNHQKLATFSSHWPASRNMETSDSDSGPAGNRSDEVRSSDSDSTDTKADLVNSSGAARSDDSSSEDSSSSNSSPIGDSYHDSNLKERKPPIYLFTSGACLPAMESQPAAKDTTTLPKSEPETARDYISLDIPDSGKFSTEFALRPPDSPPPSTEPELCEEQANLVNLIASGANVFYTGSAGCGKSTVLKAFIQRLRDSGKIVKIVAPTGKAAINIGGTTFWSYAGWHPDSMKCSLKKLEDGARNYKYVNKRLCKTDVLVIDEISMLENHHFERLNRAMKAARNNENRFDQWQAERNSEAPFGGVQLVVTGDFCQLPPVKPFSHCLYCGRSLSANETQQIYTCPNKVHGPFYDVDKWAFRSSAWKECHFAHVNLTSIHRQSDKNFITILQKFRFGKPLKEKERYLLLNHESETANAVKLFPLVRQVREVNAAAFNQLPGPALSFNCLDSYEWNKEHTTFGRHWGRYDDQSLKCQDEHRLERRLEMKKGMLVILLVNLDFSLGLVNGAQGVILGFRTCDPNKLPEQVGHHAEVKTSQIKDFLGRAESKMWPWVEFEGKERKVTRLIKPYCTVDELGESQPHSWVSRTQIPLLAAWAITVHKAQGMTLSRVEIDVSKSFEKGQTYVALSRATSLGGLKVHALSDCDQGGNEQVMGFLQEKFGDIKIEDIE